MKSRNTGKRMLNKLNENLKRMKNNQSGIKDTLIERKNNLQGVNSRKDESEIQISDLEYNEAKNTQSE